MSNRDWLQTYKEFVKHNQDLDKKGEKQLSAAAYGRLIGVNENTIRRAFNNVKKELDGDGGNANADRSRKKSTKNSDRSQNTDKSKKPKKSTRKSKAKGVDAHASEITPLDEDVITEEFDQASFSRFPKRQIHGSLQRRTDGDGVMHGAYIDIAKIPEDIREAAALLTQDDGILLLQTSRYLNMHRNLNEMVEAIDKDYDDGKPWKDDFGNDMPRSKTKSAALYGTSKAMTSLEESIEKIRVNRAKLALDEEKLALEHHNAHPLSRQQQIIKSKQLLAYIKECNEDEDKESISAVKAAYLFDEYGLTVPTTLQAEAAKEISLREPEKEEAPEVTAEELDQLMADFEEQNAHWNDAFLQERLAAVEELKDIDADGGVEVIE